MMTLRDRFLSAGQAAVPRRIVTLSIDGEQVALEVRGLTAGARGTLLQQATTRVDDELVADAGKMTVLMVVACTYELQGGPLFTVHDIEALESCAATWLDQLFTVASELSGMSTTAVADAKGNSAATATSGSGISSPASSVA
jgi:hypothetical protein